MRKTWHQHEFNGGIDLRDGVYRKSTEALIVGQNVYIDGGKKPVRRPPCKKQSGSLANTTQGLIMLNGVRTTFAKKDAGGVSTVENTQILRFDNPAYCDEWELLDAGVFSDAGWALIKHTHDDPDYPFLVMYHVWDGDDTKPTYVTDPYFPGLFHPSIVDLDEQTYDAAFMPVIGQGASKQWVSNPKGNIRSSRTADSRWWNERTKDGVLANGEYYAFVCPGGVQVRQFTVPRLADWMSGDQYWAYYVLERNVGGEWTPMEEVTGTPSADYTWSWSSIASPYPELANVIQIDLKWGSASAGPIRMRLVAGDTAVQVPTLGNVNIVANTTTGQWRVEVEEMIYRHRNNNLVTVPLHYTADLPTGAATFLLAVSADAAITPELVNITAGFTLTGWEREHARFIKKITTDVQLDGETEFFGGAWQTDVGKTGTANTTIGNTQVNGTGTLFVAQFAPGDKIVIDGEEQTVDTITSQTVLDTVGNWAVGHVAQQPHLRLGYANFDGSITEVYVDSTIAAAAAVNRFLSIGVVVYKIEAIDSGDNQRLHISINGTDGDYTANTDRFQDVILLDDPVVEDYYYPFDAEADNLWYVERIIDATNQAGADDAISLGTSTLDNSGGRVTAIASVKARMLICFQNSMQLWAIDQSTALIAHLDSLSFGTGRKNTVTAPAVSWYGSIVVPTNGGWRAIQAVGNNLDNLQDLNIGAPIGWEGYAQDFIGETIAGAYWPEKGQIALAVDTESNGLTLLVFCYSRENRMSAWCSWKTTAFSTIDDMTVDNEKLLIRSGNDVFAFDYTDADHIDTNAAGSEIAYETVAQWPLNHFGYTRDHKRFTAVDVVQDGTSTINFKLPPFNQDEGRAYRDGPTIAGITYGRRRIPLLVTSSALSIEIKSTDRSGWRLQEIALAYILLRRR